MEFSFIQKTNTLLTKFSFLFILWIVSSLLSSNVYGRSISKDVKEEKVYEIDNIPLTKYTIKYGSHLTIGDKETFDVENVSGEVDSKDMNENEEDSLVKRLVKEDEDGKLPHLSLEEMLETDMDLNSPDDDHNGDEMEDFDDSIPISALPEEYQKDNHLNRRASISSSEYFYAQLSSFEKKIYTALNNISKPSTISTFAITLNSLTSYKIKKSYILKYTSRAVGALIRDHPEYWWIKKFNISYSISSNYISKLKVTLASLYSTSNVNSYKSKVKSRSSSIASAAKQKSTKYLRLRYLHDYLVKYIKYDDGYTYSYSMYGAIVKNTCSCEGYAESFTYIARQLGVGTISVTGSTHKWNFVYISGKWYVVDVTFDDPTVNGKVYDVGETKNLSRKFFLIGSSTIVKGSKTYKTYSDRNLVNYVEFKEATGFKFPTLSKTAYEP